MWTPSAPPRAATIGEIRLGLGGDDHGRPMLLRRGGEGLHLVDQGALVGRRQPQQDGRDAAGRAGLGEAWREGGVVQDGGDEIEAGGGIGHGPRSR